MKTRLLMYSCAAWIAAAEPSLAQKDSGQQFRNIVIGDGCASTCVDGKCEKTCNNSELDKASKSSVVEKDFAYKDFNIIVISDVDVEVVYGPDYVITLFDTAESIDQVEVNMDDDALIVSLSDEYKSQYMAKLRITTPTLNNLRVDGNSDVSMHDFAVQHFSLDLSDNASLKGEANRFKKLLLSADKNTDVNFKNSSVTIANVTLVDNATVSLNFEPNTESQLSGSVDGMADLLYCGQPEQSLLVSDLADATAMACD